jgi:multidrug efflux pump subunit AcrA (membrane-fusion protein)
MKLSRRLGLQLLVVVALGAVTWFWLSSIGAKKMASPGRARAEGRPIPVRTAEVAEDEITDVLGATGLTIPSETAAILMSSSRAYETGDLMVKEVLVWEGKRVQKGEVLFQLDAGVFEQAVNRAAAEVASAEADLRRALRSLELNKKTRQLEVESATAELDFRNSDFERRSEDHERLDALYEGGFLSMVDYNASKTALIEASYRHKEAEYNYRHADAELSVGLLEDEERVAEAREGMEVARVSRMW